VDPGLDVLQVAGARPVPGIAVEKVIISGSLSRALQYTYYLHMAQDKFVATQSSVDAIYLVVWCVLLMREAGEKTLASMFDILDTQPGEYPLQKSSCNSLHSTSISHDLILCSSPPPNSINPFTASHFLPNSVSFFPCSCSQIPRHPLCYSRIAHIGAARISTCKEVHNPRVEVLSIKPNVEVLCISGCRQNGGICA
jgi:hypothetical protein